MVHLQSHRSAPSASFDSYPDGAHARSRFTPKSNLLLSLSALLFLLLLSAGSQSGSVSLDSLRDTQIGGLLQNYVGPVQQPQNLESICPECNCTIPGSFLLSPQWSQPIPTYEKVRSPRASKAAIKRYLINEISNYLWLHPHFLPEKALAPLFSQYFTCPDRLFSLNFNGLQYDKPTLYMYTRTGDGGRLKANEKRIKYFKRHAETIREYNALVEAEGFRDGLKAKDRQLIWVIIEDGEQINETLDEIMRISGIPYIYFAHGPTRFYGNAQWNAAERAVHVLRDTFFGDGPVLNVDDDSKIMPELLQRVWKVKKAVLWQVGNLGGRKDLWEGPEFKDGKIVDWVIGGLPNRLFPIDMGGFAYNSSQIGTARAIDGPAYIPENHFGGESEFLAQVLKDRDEIEPLCENTRAEKCYLTWHNWMTPNEEDNLKPPV